MVAMALNIPLATRSISASICCSVEDGELRIAYVGCGIGGMADVEDAGGAGGGRREKSDGEGAIKERYWSMTWEEA